MQKSKSKTQQFSLNQIIVVAFMFMMIGTAMELYLLEHYEDALQLIPLICIGASLMVMIVLFFRRAGIIELVFKLILGLTALSGFYGVFLHLRANYEFELEMKPTARGWDLFMESLSGALPTLAPGSMIVLALIGYSYLLLLKQNR